MAADHQQGVKEQGRSRTGGQGPYLRSPDHLGRSSEVKEIKSIKKLSVTDRPTNRPTDKAGCRVACTRLKILILRPYLEKEFNFLDNPLTD